MKKTTAYIGAGVIAILLVLVSLVFIRTVLLVAKHVQPDTVLVIPVDPQILG